MFGFLSLMKNAHHGALVPEVAAIGEDGPNDTVAWNMADYDYCIMQYNAGVLQYRGYSIVNGITTHMFYLPLPPHTYSTGP